MPRQGMGMPAKEGRGEGPGAGGRDPGLAGGCYTLSLLPLAPALLLCLLRLQGPGIPQSYRAIITTTYNLITVGAKHGGSDKINMVLK